MTHIEKLKAKITEMIHDYYTNPSGSMIERKEMLINDVQYPDDKKYFALKSWHDNPDNKTFPTTAQIKQLCRAVTHNSEMDYYNLNKHAWLHSLVIDEEREHGLALHYKKQGVSYTPMHLAWIGFFQHLKPHERVDFNQERERLGNRPFREYQKIELKLYYVDVDVKGINNLPKPIKTI